MIYKIYCIFDTLKGMGFLKDGQWISEGYFNIDQSGSFDRPVSVFRELVSHKHPTFKPEANRYHLYVSYACPWAHRTLIMRQLKQLESFISVSVVLPDMLENGWEFGTSFPHATEDHNYHVSYLHQLYTRSNSSCTSRVTVPVLYDTQQDCIVNNESSEIIRLFNSEFNELSGNSADFYPEQLQDDINEMNETIYHRINNGVYKAGFAQTQEAYDQAVNELFDALDKLDHHLKTQQFLVHNQLTEADIRLIPTLLRFDCVYHTHFKCNKKQIRQYPHLYDYVLRLYDLPAVKDTTFFDHIIRHYYYSHKKINTFQIVPVCPDPIL